VIRTLLHPLSIIAYHAAKNGTSNPAEFHPRKLYRRHLGEMLAVFGKYPPSLDRCRSGMFRYNLLITTVSKRSEEKYTGYAAKNSVILPVRRRIRIVSVMLSETYL